MQRGILAETRKNVRDALNLALEYLEEKAKGEVVEITAWLVE